MRYKLLLIFFATVFITVWSDAASVDEYIAKGDSLHKLFDNKGAEENFILALEIESDNAEILWRLSRTMVDIGEHLAKDKQEAYYQAASDYADKAIAADQNNAQGHLRRAIASGRMALFNGVFKSISLVKEVRASLDICLSIEPDNAVAHYVLARTHDKLCQKPKIARKLLGLSWADIEISDKEFNKAIALDSTYIMFHYDYALMLMNQRRYTEAEKQLKLVVDLPVRDEDDETKKVEAEKLLVEMRNK